MKQSWEKSLEELVGDIARRNREWLKRMRRQIEAAEKSMR